MTRTPMCYIVLGIASAASYATTFSAGESICLLQTGVERKSVHSLLHTPHSDPDPRIDSSGGNASKFDVRTAGKRFDSEQCKAARENDGKQAWKLAGGKILQLMEGDLEWHNDIFITAYNGYKDERIGEYFPENSTSPLIAYVRNQKVASVYMGGSLGFIFGGRPSARFLSTYQNASALPSDVSDFQGRHLHPRPTNPVFAFTIVRDPFETVLAGYLEMTITRASSYDGKKVEDRFKQFLDMPCTTSQQATKRFVTFLKVLQEHGVREEGQTRPNLGKETFHIYPQALKLSVRLEGRDTTFDAVGRLENFLEDLQEIRRLSTGVDNSSFPPATDVSSHSHALEGCANVDRSNKDMMLRFCELYYADYVCFDNYDPPAACKNMFN